MKISLLGPVYPYRGGISHFHTLLGEALEHAGHEIQVISFKKQYPAWLYPGKSDKDPNLKTTSFPVSYLLDPLNPWSWLKTVAAVREMQTDLVLFQWWTVAWAPAWTWICWQLNRCDIKKVFIIHNVMPHEPGRLDPWLAKLALKQTDGFITFTDRESQRLRSLLGTISNPVLTLSLPTYRLGDQPVSDRQTARARLGLLSDVPVLLFFGFVRPYKGLHYLIEACGMLKEKQVQSLLVIAGEFWEDPQIYLDQIHHLDLDNSVRVENRYLPDDEAALWFCAADLFVAPYIDGTQSAALRIALGYGLPIVATDAISSELTGIDPACLSVVPARDAGALAEAIQRVLAEPGIFAKIPAIDQQWSQFVGVIEQSYEAVNAFIPT